MEIGKVVSKTKLFFSLTKEFFFAFLSVFISCKIKKDTIPFFLKTCAEREFEKTPSKTENNSSIVTDRADESIL